jgi:hypothetical protein
MYRRSPSCQSVYPFLRVSDSPLGLVIQKHTSRSKRTHSSIAEIPFFLREELGGLGVIWQEEPNENTDNDSRDTFENEAGLSVSNSGE